MYFSCIVLILLASSCSKSAVQLPCTKSRRLHTTSTTAELVEVAALGRPHPRCRAAAAHRKAVTESPPQARKELCNELQDVLPKTRLKRVCKVVQSCFLWDFQLTCSASKHLPDKVIKSAMIKNGMGRGNFGSLMESCRLHHAG